MRPEGSGVHTSIFFSSPLMQNGKISFEEFVCGLAILLHGSFSDKCKILFQVMCCSILCKGTSQNENCTFSITATLCNPPPLNVTHIYTCCFLFYSSARVNVEESYSAPPVCYSMPKLCSCNCMSWPSPPTMMLSVQFSF